DNFNDDKRDSAKWYAFGEYREINGRLELSPTGVSGQYAGYESATTYDLAGSEISVELVHPLVSFSGAETILGVDKDSSNSVAISVANDRIYAEVQVAGTYTTPAYRAYDPVRDRWLRIREKDGTTYWETSPDGQTWGLLHSMANPVDPWAVEIKLSAGTYKDLPQPGTAVFDNFNVRTTTSLARRVEERRLSALVVRGQAAQLAAARRHEEHANNNDETNYPALSFPGNYSKGLRHDAVGDPEPVSYGSMLRALESRDPQDFEEIILGTLPEGTARVKLTNPQAGLAFDTEGPDPQELTQPPAPRFDSARAAHEAGELYWMAKARDVHFADYGTNPVIAAAVASLNQEFPQYGGPRPVTTANVFRGVFTGAAVGPYVSQFLLKGNADPRKPDGMGRDANEGYITYGSQVIDQRQLNAKPGIDYLKDFPTWLEAQNGKDLRGGDQLDTVRRFIRNLRDGATYVHFDQPSNAFYNAGWILMAEPTGDQLNGVGAGRPQVDAEFPMDQGNPYDPPGTSGDSRTQAGFTTFGPVHLLTALLEVQGRAARAVWWQKWGVHRRLRPEEYGGRVDNQLKGRRSYPLHTSILTSLQTGGLSPYYPATGSYLLPQAFPEGAPTHPAYGAGHATISGACITILKAFFDDGKTIENPVIASADGLSLVPYTGTDAAQMTVGGELNKLAHNISLFRNAGGVHWRSDDTESLALGERIAIRLLQEMSLGFNEDDAFFQITRLDGRTVRIFDGVVEQEVY
ncbi:MAG TPA: vanadium-dependent haloperoxidase, partial [Longimicrobium sp.]|nr:vanadium-dependent haloperoxidase [Longimicrobium sp.]